MLKLAQEMVRVRYQYTPYHEFVSDDDLVADLVRVAQFSPGAPLTQKKYNEMGKYSSEKIVYRFGTWNNALEKAGLKLSLNKQYSNKELFENLERVWQSKGKQPVRNDMNNPAISSISSGAYLRRFGSWTDALKLFVEFMENDELEESTENTATNPPIIQTREVNLRLRWKVMRRDNFKCCLCGASPAKDPSVELHVDHIIPWSKGGSTTMDNLRTLCSKCNLGKSDLIE